LDASDDYFSFALNDLPIKDNAQLKLFMQLYAHLIELTDGECTIVLRGKAHRQPEDGSDGPQD
jgi:hypothetical protein